MACLAEALAKVVGGAGNAPAVTSDSYLRQPDLQAGSRNTPKIGSRVGSRATESRTRGIMRLA